MGFSLQVNHITIVKIALSRITERNAVFENRSRRNGNIVAVEFITVGFVDIVNCQRILCLFCTDVIGNKQALELIYFYAFKECLAAHLIIGGCSQITVFGSVFICFSPSDLLGSTVCISARRGTLVNIRRMRVTARCHRNHVNFVIGCLNTGDTVHRTIISSVRVLYNITIAKRNCLICRAIKSHCLARSRE